MMINKAQELFFTALGGTLAAIMPIMSQVVIFMVI